MNASTTPTSVLIVEDAPEFARLIETVLAREGFRVEVAADGESAVATARRMEPDVIVLDIGLPGIDGIEVCRRVREFSDSYLIILSGRSDEVDKLVGLSMGADDYLTKPFSHRELVARIRAMMRRPRSGPEGDAASQPEDRRVIGLLEIDTQARRVYSQGQELTLTRIEYSLLETLSARPRMIHSRQVLLDQVWGPSWCGDDHLVDVHIANLRRKIDNNGVRHIVTVRGFGYRMMEPVAVG